MKYSVMAFVLSFTMFASAQQSPAPLGKWRDISKDASGTFYIGNADSSSHILLHEEYEVLQTHEICASVFGYFMEKSNVGRYDVNFKGMRTTSTFTFTTQYDAEAWVKKFCTPESLTSIKAGKGTFARSY